MDEALNEVVAILSVDPFYRETGAFFERLAMEAMAGDAAERRVAQQIVSVIASGQFADIVIQDSGVVLPEQSQVFGALERLRVAAFAVLRSSE